MIKVCESSDFEILEIRQILENNNIEVYESQKYFLINSPSTVSAGSNYSIQLKVKKSDYLKAKKILKKAHKKNTIKTTGITQHLEQIKQLDYLIRSKNTGELNALSKQMKISQRQILFKLDFLKSLNAKIKFSKELNSFFYTEPFEILFQFSLLSITDEDTVEIYCSSEDKTTVIFKNKSEYL